MVEGETRARTLAKNELNDASSRDELLLHPRQVALALGRGNVVRVPAVTLELQILKGGDDVLGRDLVAELIVAMTPGLVRGVLTHEVLRDVRAVGHRDGLDRHRPAEPPALDPLLARLGGSPTPDKGVAGRIRLCARTRENTKVVRSSDARD